MVYGLLRLWPVKIPSNVDKGVTGMSGVRLMKVKDADDGARLDRWFKKYVPEIGFGQLQKLMRKGSIRLDGKRVKGKERLEAGQEIRVPPVQENPDARPAKKPRLTRMILKKCKGGFYTVIRCNCY